MNDDRLELSDLRPDSAGGPPRGGLRPIPAGYLLTLGLAIISFPCLGIGLGGVLLGRAGRDPFDAWGVIGMTCFVASYGLGYGMRFIFWRRSSPALAAGVRKALIGVMAVLFVATVAAVIIAFSPGAAPGWALAFIVFAVLAQVPNLIWLIRYRNVT